MGGDGVAGGGELVHAFRIGARLLTDGEEDRLDAIIGEDLQHLVAVAGQRPIIEGQDHLVIPERQRLGILHGADSRMFARIDHQGTRTYQHCWHLPTSSSNYWLLLPCMSLIVAPFRTRTRTAFPGAERAKIFQGSCGLLGCSAKSTLMTQLGLRAVRPASFFCPARNLIYRNAC